jgi:hypothetical protein
MKTPNWFINSILALCIAVFVSGTSNAQEKKSDEEGRGKSEKVEKAQKAPAEKAPAKKATEEEAPAAKATEEKAPAKKATEEEAPAVKPPAKKAEAEKADKAAGQPAGKKPEEKAETQSEGQAEAEPQVEVEAEAEIQSDVGAEAEVEAETEQELLEPVREPEPEEAVEEPKLLQGTWTKKIVFSTEDGSFKFQPRGWVQPRFQMAINPDAVDALEGTGFSLKRARLGFQAWFFDWARVYLDTDFASGTGKLVDYFVDLDPFGGKAVLRIGHFRPWYCRQILNATTELAMIEYAKAWQDATLGLKLDRDIGAAVHGMVAGGIEYGFGIWNGENTFDTTGNLDFELGGRVAAHPLALAGGGEVVPIGDESDPEISTKPGLSVGFAMLYERRHDNFIEVDGQTWEYYDHQFKLGLDAAFNYVGLSLQGELFVLDTKLQGDTPDDFKNEILEADRARADNLVGVGYGAYLQAGYFVLPRQFEAVARFDIVDEDSDGLRGLRLFPALGGSYYFFGHNLKAQLMYRLSACAGYGDTDPGYIPTSHDIFLMFQASI